ncbi:hypothetical protein LCGC14_0423050 [marine sediment metagenome]|uniref:Uncharacterized protein n=1 Tax=marine sediment metagenome TaxID=412755 RepID=A0A0F9T8H5_9ZZZZ
MIRFKHGHIVIDTRVTPSKSIAVTDLDDIIVEGTMYWGGVPIKTFDKERLIKIIYVLTDEKLANLNKYM